MAQTIAGFFRTRNEGEAAQQALLAAGFTPDQVSLLAADNRAQEPPAIGPIKETGAEGETAEDAWIGGAVGLAAGMIALAIPGIGPLVAIGPLAGAIGGLGIGAAAGGLIGLLKDHGVSDEEAKFYAEGVKRGGALVTVRGISEDQAKEARRILKDKDAIDTEKLAEEYRLERQPAR